MTATNGGANGRATNGSGPHRVSLSGDAERVRALEAAVRAHQLVTANLAVPRRPADHELYRRLG